MTMMVHSVVALGMLVLMPLGLRLIDDDGVRAVRRLWWVFAAPGVVSLLLPRGVISTTLACIYAIGALLLVAAAADRFRRLFGAHQPGLLLNPPEVALLTGLICPAIAATALVAERAGQPLFGFSLGILALTVPHLHFAGFAAALIAGLVSRELGPGRLCTVASLAVPIGTMTVLLGYFTGRWIELLGAAILTVGMWSVGYLTVTRIGPLTNGTTKLMLTISSGTLVVTMLLALSWALGRAAGFPHPSITWMVATHGIANAVGFALCGVLAWRLLTLESLRTEAVR